MSAEEQQVSNDYDWEELRPSSGGVLGNLTDSEFIRYVEGFHFTAMEAEMFFRINAKMDFVERTMKTLQDTMRQECLSEMSIEILIEELNSRRKT